MGNFISIPKTLAPVKLMVLPSVKRRKVSSESRATEVVNLVDDPVQQKMMAPTRIPSSGEFFRK